VPIPAFLRDRLAAELHAQGDAGPEALVFRSPNGDPLSHSNFRRRVWLPALRASGLSLELRIHDLRHTCVALLIARHAHPKEIQLHLGHASITTTLDRYGELFPNRLDELGQQLDEVYRTSLTRPPRGLLDVGDDGRQALQIVYQRERQWGGLDSNQRPTDYESAALTN